jgi:hypothetical protein
MKPLITLVFLFALLPCAFPPLTLSADEPKSAVEDKAAPRQPILQQFGIEHSTPSAQIFNKVVDAATLELGVGQFIKGAVDKCRAEAAKMGKTPNSIAGMAGQWLELALLVALKHKGFTPIYYQFELHNVPNATMDVAVFSEKHGPIVLSCKTSLRERYKQAQQEAVATRQAHPRSCSFIVTLDEDKRHIENIRKKIENKEVQAIEGLFDETNLDKLFELLAKEKLVEPTDKMLKRARLMVK